MAVTAKLQLLILSCVLALSACNSGDSPSTAANPMAATPSAPSSTPTTSDALSIAGSPAMTAVAGSAYSFTPTVSGAGGALTFAVQNLPVWAQFNSVTGEISGTPATANIGQSSFITVSVSDGTASVNLASFSIKVSASPSITAELSWVAPSSTSGGSAPLLGGFHIHYGNNPAQLSHVLDVSNAGVTTYTIADLTHGTWYFAITAYNTANVESLPSAIVSAVL